MPGGRIIDAPRPEQRSVAALPDEVLPAPSQGSLPAPVSLRGMVGPGIILVGLSIGSGEFVLWPRLTAEWGFTLFWACWVGVTIQFFLNMEIERYTLATGESAVTGFVRLSRRFGPIFLVCCTLPWVWPGWATGAATLLTWQVGGEVVPIAIAGLLFCGALLSLGPVVYRTVESLQMFLVGSVVVLVSILAAFVVTWDSIAELGAGALAIGQVPKDMDLPLLLGALAFAGAGGSANLAQSNYIKDKGYGMGRFIGRLTSPFTGREEAGNELGFVFSGTPDELQKWKLWWRRANLEQFCTFFVLCLVSLAVFCLLTYDLVGESAQVPEGIGFIRAEAEALHARFGSWASRIFLIVGVLVLFSTEVGILDAVSRVAADLVKVTWLRESDVWTLSRIYFAVLWTLVGFGIVVLLIGLDQPLLLLILSACLNAIVMFLYSGLLLWLGWRCFSPPLRPSLPRSAMLVVSLVFFGYFSVTTVLNRLS